jgi:hypothetical protein
VGYNFQGNRRKTMANKQVTLDEARHHEAAVAEATRNLQAALHAAWDAGMEVEFHVREETVFGRYDRRPVVRTTVTVPVSIIRTP